MNPYSYVNGELNASLELKQTNSKWSRYNIDFPTAHPTRYEENNTVHGEYFQPEGITNAPMVILLHGMGDELLVPCKSLAKTLVRKGFACFVLYSVLHSRRTPETVRKRLPTLTAEEWFETYQISVIDVRQIIDWAGSRSEIDREKIAVLGISFGGFISAITMGVDERIKAGIFLVTGGNSGKVGYKNRQRSMKKEYRLTEEEYHQNQKCYQQYLTEIAEKGFENVTPPIKSFLVDPMTYAAHLRERPMLMLNASWDEYVPREATLDLWEASGKPSITWFPATHTSFWLWYPLIRRKIARFLKSTFNGHEEIST
ncbi:alpha/beta hydrolase family protein [Chloroflexota bacterium]